MPYAPFDGIVLTDTFQLYEQDKDMIADLLPDNSERRTAQKERDIRVIVGNPPYSSGQRNANDDAANVVYENLDSSIAATYVDRSSNKMGKSKLYDSYIRAIRWASDRVGDSGVVGFVSGSAWAEKSYGDGMRKCLWEENSTLYLINLRGDIRKNMLSKGAAKEGENVFGSGSMTGVAIVIFAKNAKAESRGVINYLDIGDDLPKAHKLAYLKQLKNVADPQFQEKLKQITPDDHGDWLSHRDRAFDRFIAISDKHRSESIQIFETYSMGIKSNRDTWVYNFSRKKLSKNVKAMISFYNSERSRLEGSSTSELEKNLNRDKSKIKWTTDLQGELKRGVRHKSDKAKIQKVEYSAFTKSWWYSDSSWNWTRHLMPKFYPTKNEKNLTISVNGRGSRNGFTALLISEIPDVNFLEAGAQCFPLKLYEPASADDGLFATGETGYTERDGISDAGLKHFKDAYVGEQISKEDLFYYVYGLLHSPDYRERFKNNLSKELPRIPAVKTTADFWAFSKAGKALGDLHVNYETVEPYMVTFAEGNHLLAPEAQSNPEAFYRVTKMKFGGKGKAKDKTTVHYNTHITITGIPLEAYDYVVNGKPALDWVMERQCVKTDKSSGIVNDANRYANETVGNPAYPLEPFQRVITVSLETMTIVNGLPALDID